MQLLLTVSPTNPTWHFIEEMSTEDICVFNKQWEEENIWIIYNISQNENSVDVSSLSDSKVKICGSLLTQEGELVLEDGKITLSPYSIVLLK